MSELRAPDPTLTAYWQEEGYGVDVAVRDPYVDVAVAHRIVGQTRVACGASWEWWFTHPVFAARWFAVPCLRCFPNAPEAGHPATCDGGPACPDEPHPYLSWQVSS